MAHELIDSTEMYLRTVLELEEEGIPPLRARLSERLGLSAPSVSEGVARLEAQGLVHLGEDRRVGLTEAGREWATHVMRKHRLAERLLSDVIGLEPELVHDEACRWEHVISDRVADKLDVLLEHPGTSPYGNPIPGGGQDDTAIVPLASALPGRVRLHSISESLQSDAEVIAALHDGEMWAGAEVEVHAEGDDVVLTSGTQRAVIPLAAARLIYVPAD